MKQKKRYQQWIWLDLYGELPPEQKKLLDKHLKTCPECQLDYEEAQQTLQLLDKKNQIRPTKEMLKQSRSELYQRLLLATQPKLKTNWSEKIWRIFGLTRLQIGSYILINQDKYKRGD